MKNFLTVLFFTASLSLFAQKTTFSSDALMEKMTALDGKDVSFESILKKYKGKTIVIDVWASWCSDCIKGMPKVKELQSTYKKDVVYLFLSLDRAADSWKNGIKKYEVTGEHYYIKSGWKDSKFCADIELDWIPRYMIVDKTGKISLYKAIEANDEHLINTLKSLQ